MNGEEGFCEGGEVSRIVEVKGKSEENGFENESGKRKENRENKTGGRRFWDVKRDLEGGVRNRNG